MASQDVVSPLVAARLRKLGPNPENEMLGNKTPKINIALVMIYVAALVCVLVVKEKILDDGGYRIMSRMMGQDDGAPGFLWKFGFFSTDILLMVVGVPVALAIIHYLGGERLYARSVLLLSISLIVLSFVNLNAIGATGKFLSADQIAPMLSWVRERPGAFFEYVSASALVKFTILLCAVFVLYWFRRARVFASFQPGAVLCIYFFAAIALAAIFSRIYDKTPKTGFDAPVAIQMAKALFPDERFGGLARGLDPRPQNFKHSCSNVERAYGGARSESDRPNIVLFIMETVPYDLFADAKTHGLPTFAKMEKSALVDSHHYTTYPFTSYARFSIFTGLYPSYRLEKTLPLKSSHPYDSGFAMFAKDGYDFEVFDPVTKRYAVDDWVVHQLGGKVVSTDSAGDVEMKDDAVLASLVASIKANARMKKPFVYAYLPQLTHGPWLAPGADKSALYAEGSRRLEILDHSLAAIVAALRESGTYDDTVIVVTADHGLRTKNEAGFLKTTVLNDVSYHVPMLIHDPRLKKTVAISSYSSHVDLSPTLYCLYAHGKSDIDTQGTVIGSPAARDRKIFFGGDWYNGSSGLLANGSFYSFNRQLNMLWESASFNFDETRPLKRLDSERGIVRLLNAHRRLQETLLGAP